MSEFDFFLRVTVTEDNFTDAQREAMRLAEGVGMSGENISFAWPDGYDNEGQRVFYLPPEAND